MNSENVSHKRSNTSQVSSLSKVNNFQLNEKQDMSDVAINCKKYIKFIDEKRYLHSNKAKAKIELQKKRAHM